MSFWQTSMYASKRLLMAGLLIALTTGFQAHSADNKKADPNKEQVKRLQQAQRKLEQEKVLLAQEKANVEAERDAARKKAEGEGMRAAGLSREVRDLRKAREDLAVRLSDTETELVKSREQLRQLESEGKRLQGTLTGEKQAHASCVARNREMHQAGMDLVEKYRAKTCSDGVLQHEPFTGLKRVEIENTAEDMKDRLDSHKIGS